MAGVPYEGTEGEEAGEWLDSVTKFEEEIRERVAELLQARMDRWNNSHLDAPVYLLGHMVWYRHPVEPKLGWSTPSEGERGRVQLPVVDGAT